MPGKCEGPNYFVRKFGKMKKETSGGHDSVGRVDRQCEVLIWCRKMLGSREAEIGTKIDDLLQARASGHPKILARCSNEFRSSQTAKVPAKEAKNLED